MTAATATRPPMRPPMRGSVPPPPVQQKRAAVKFGKITKGGGHRIVLYGPGGIGKTTLASQLPGPVAFIDLDDSLPRLASQLDTSNILPVSGVETWDHLRESLQADGWDQTQSIVIDTGTRAEEMAIAHTLEHTLADGKRVFNVEGYGYGHGSVSQMGKML